ncbi:MAG: hypothetical protein ACXVLT_14535 [Flavisolibacter sp.]
MGLNSDIIKKLNRKFDPSATTHFRYGSNDVVIRADEEGNVIRAFIGNANSEGIIKRDRYRRVLKKDNNGNLIKDHWERKGKASWYFSQKFPILKH